AEAIRDGWLHTGDLGMIDRDGYVASLDRKKNIIIRGGENISGLEVEGALHKHPKVMEAAVFSVPDERLGEIVGAALCVSEEVGAAELAEFLGPHLAAFKHPERYWMQGEPLLRGATDKIDRRAIRAACLAATEAA
ncbi:MAG: AMP-binding enzyme, partial [Pikeienuella sp.]